MNRKLAYILSGLLHPLLLPTLLFAVIIFFAPILLSPFPENKKYYFLLIVFILTFIIPSIMIFFLYKVGNISSLKMDKRNERIWPLISTSILYIANAYMFYSQLNFNDLLILIMIFISFTICIVTLITLFWKISAHSVGISGFVGFLTAISCRNPGNELLYPIMVAIIVAGILMSARLSLNSHTPAQVFAGFGLGLIISFGSIIIFI